MSQGLDAFIPEIRHPQIGGKSVNVAPLKVRQIPPFVRALGPAFGPLSHGRIDAAIGLHGEALIEAIAIATGESSDWLGDLDADEFMRLVGDVVEVNADFFVHRVLPTLNATVDKVTTALAGPMASPASPVAASDSTPPSA
jgi:hypothetical protein